MIVGSALCYYYFTEDLTCHLVVHNGCIPPTNDAQKPFQWKKPEKVEVPFFASEILCIPEWTVLTSASWGFRTVNYIALLFTDAIAAQSASAHMWFYLILTCRELSFIASGVGLNCVCKCAGVAGKFKAAILVAALTSTQLLNRAEENWWWTCSCGWNPDWNGSNEVLKLSNEVTLYYS